MDILQIVDVEVTKCWYGEKLDGTALKQKEVNTSHGMDVEKVEAILNAG